MSYSYEVIDTSLSGLEDLSVFLNKTLRAQSFRQIILIDIQ